MSRRRRSRLTDADVLADLGGAGDHRIRLVRAEGALGARPLMVVRDIPPMESLRSPDDLQDRIREGCYVSHPSWVRIFGAVRVSGRPGLATEFVAGCDLTEFARRVELPIPVIAYIGAQLASVMETLHHGRDLLGRPRRLVHGSITPDKILLSFAGDVKLADFAVTKTTVRSVEGVDTWPLPIRPWIPPEQQRGGAPNPGGDLFMLGCTLYTLLSGRPPAPLGRSMSAEHWAQLHPPSMYRSAVPPSLDALVMSLLDPNPSARPGTAREVQEVLGAADGRAGLAAAVRDAVPDQYRRIEALLDKAPQDVVPLVHAEIEVDGEVAPRRPEARNTKALVAHTPLPRPSFIALPPQAELRDDPIEDSLTDSVEEFRSAVQLIWADARPLPSRDGVDLPALPSGAVGAPDEVDQVDEVDDVDDVGEPRPPDHRWRRPAGLMMALAALIVLVWTADARPEPGFLEVVTVPFAGTVELDGRALGSGRIQLPAGSHQLHVRAPGHVPRFASATLRPGEHRVMVIHLSAEVAAGPSERPL